MAFKQFNLENIGQVTVYKRAGTRSIRLTIRSDGSVRVTIPAWAPYTSGVSFAKSRAAWIAKHTPKKQTLLSDGQSVGKQAYLRFVHSADSKAPSGRVKPDSVVVTIPSTMQWVDTAAQQAARRAILKVLRNEAEELLPPRLADLANLHGFNYRSVQVKNLKTRWGSCDQDQNIVLNLFLMQLPWHLIDYVLLHELTHTKIMQHGPIFWRAMEALEPGTSVHRKQLRDYKTTILAQN